MALDERGRGARRRPARIGLIFLSLATACDDPTGLPDPFCSEQPDDAVVVFEDARLAAAIRSALGLRGGAGITCGLAAGLTELDASYRGIESIAGIENLTALTTLWIRANAITDIQPVAGLTRLTSLNLAGNSLTDITPLEGLTELTFLAINENKTISDLAPLSGLTNLTGTLWIADNSIADLGPLEELTALTGINAWDNAITDLDGLDRLTGLTSLRFHFNAITDVGSLSGLTSLEIVWLHHNEGLGDVQGLLDNPGLTAGSSLNLTATSVSCEDVEAIEAKGATVLSDCP